MDIDHKLIDAALRDEIAWCRSGEAANVTHYTLKERRAFVTGLRQARFLLREVIKAQRGKGKR